MLTIFGLKVSIETAAFFSLFIASELIGISKYRSNSVAQLIQRAAGALKPLRTEDDLIEKIRDLLK